MAHKALRQNWCIIDEPLQLRKQLLKLTKPELIKICKSKGVLEFGTEHDIIRRLIRRNKLKRKQRLHAMSYDNRKKYVIYGFCKAHKIESCVDVLSIIHSYLLMCRDGALIIESGETIALQSNIHGIYAIPRKHEFDSVTIKNKGVLKISGGVQLLIKCIGEFVIEKGGRIDLDMDDHEYGWIENNNTDEYLYEFQVQQNLYLLPHQPKGVELKIEAGSVKVYGKISVNGTKGAKFTQQHYVDPVTKRTYQNPNEQEWKTYIKKGGSGGLIFIDCNTFIMDNSDDCYISALGGKVPDDFNYYNGKFNGKPGQIRFKIAENVSSKILKKYHIFPKPLMEY